ncbi:hypothetical protein HDU93_002130, partial [Gonapodya sp. JEL0774]
MSTSVLSPSRGAGGSDDADGDDDRPLVGTPALSVPGVPAIQSPNMISSNQRSDVGSAQSKLPPLPKLPINPFLPTMSPQPPSLVFPGQLGFLPPNIDANAASIYTAQLYAAQQQAQMQAQLQAQATMQMQWMMLQQQAMAYQMHYGKGVGAGIGSKPGKIKSRRGRGKRTHLAPPTRRLSSSSQDSWTSVTTSVPSAGNHNGHGGSTVVAEVLPNGASKGGVDWTQMEGPNSRPVFVRTWD